MNQFLGMLKMLWVFPIFLLFFGWKSIFVKFYVQNPVINLPSKSLTNPVVNLLWKSLRNPMVNLPSKRLTKSVVNFRQKA